MTDKNGNRLFFRGNEVFLKLLGENRTRKLGEIVGDTLYTVRDLARHEMRNHQQVGFNWSLIHYGLFRNVVVLTDAGEYKTTRRWVRKYGTVGKPGRSNFELQIFLKLSEFLGFIEPPNEPIQTKEPEVIQGVLFP